MMRRAANLWLSLSALAFGPMALVSVGPYIEGRLFPVVSVFAVNRVEFSGARVRVVGEMYKPRECATVELFAFERPAGGVPGRLIDIAFLDRESKSIVSRPAGAQLWGPWEFVAHDPAAAVVLRVTHKCHPLWTVTSEFQLFPVEESEP